MQRALWDPVDPQLLGSLTEDLHFRVNGEVYRFATERTMKRFVQEPQLWCGVVRDPVTGVRFVPSTKSPSAWWTTGPYFFESDSTKDAFVENPKRYQVLREI